MRLISKFTDDSVPLGITVTVRPEVDESAPYQIAEMVRKILPDDVLKDVEAHGALVAITVTDLARASQLLRKKLPMVSVLMDQEG